MRTQKKKEYVQYNMRDSSGTNELQEQCNCKYAIFRDQQNGGKKNQWKNKRIRKYNERISVN